LSESCPVCCDNDHKSIQCGLDALQEWSDKWLLKLNSSKCKTVFYERNIDHGYKYSLHSAELENTPTIKDLSVIFDPELSFSQHCKEKINKVYAMFEIIKKNFIYLSEEAFVLLYKTLVRSHLEYANSVWNPYRMGLIKALEKVQMRATKLVMKLKHIKYKKRLERLKLPTLRYRRTRGDMIEVYKILTESYCKSVNLELELHYSALYSCYLDH